jgi:hypothetical protein
LTLQKGGRKSNGKVRVPPSNLYARWRCPDVSSDHFQETSEHSLLTERFLQLIWHHQRLLRDHLRTLDGTPLKVLHPGFWNRESGPDFRSAVVQFGTRPPCSGDVEIDLETQGWRYHRHDVNPAYSQVILHVVWEAAGTTDIRIPTLALKNVLDAPLKELKRWLGRNQLKRFADPLKGECCAPLKELPQEVFVELLRQAALIRLQSKGAEFEASARQVGWQQALWESLFGALGYKHNSWPMRRVAELVPLLQRKGQPALSFQALFLGVAGLLPAQAAHVRPSAQPYLRSLWDIWWRRREEHAEALLPAALWRLNGIRPANHPQRRLALAAHWVAGDNLMPRVEQWLGETVPDRSLPRSLLDLLQVQHDDFWSWHWTLCSPRCRNAMPLLGPQRSTDLAINVILPWLWIRAVAGKNESLQRIAEHRYFVWPRAEDNSVLRLARQRLFGNDKKPFFKTAAAQQGLLQIVRDFCDHSNARCDDCQFPQLVRQLEF